MKNPSSIFRVALKRFFDLGASEDGAALVMTLGVFFLMYLSAVGVYALSTAVRERIHLQNAADAAAYSAAVVQADTFSRVGTINRAMAWTYVQMTRRQMDYIVMKWLDSTVGHYEKDRSTAKANGGFIGTCNKGHSSRDKQYKISANFLAPANTVQLNGLYMPTMSLGLGSGLNLGDVVNIDVVKQAGLNAGGIYEMTQTGIAGDLVSLTGDSNALSLPANLTKLAASSDASDRDTVTSINDFSSEFGKKDKAYTGGGVGQYLNVMKTQILCDRLNIAAMNIASRKLVRDMPDKIERCVKDVLKANVPERMLSQCRYLLKQNKEPLKNEQVYDASGTGLGVGGYFANLHNNKDDEERFVEFAGYTDSLVKIFTESTTGIDSTLLGMSAGGFDQWFVRGNGTKRTDGGIGFQRCYKHWAEGPLASSHALHNPYPPSCWNTKKLHDSPQTIALHSQWEWFSTNWKCIYIPPTLLTPEISIHLGPMWFMYDECRFHSKPGAEWFANVEALVKWATVLDDAFSFIGSALGGVKKSGKDATVTTPDPSMEKGSGDPMSKYEWGCLGAYELLLHDWSTIQNVPVAPETVCYARMYADDKRIYNRCYVGERAKPLVMRANYFGEDGTITVGLARANENVWERILGMIEGLFTAFDPTVKWSWAFASAKAGYKFKDAATDDLGYRVDWRKDKQKWNLCQSDWDAVFVPVRQAKTQAAEGVWTIGAKTFLQQWIGERWRALMDDAPSQTGWDTVGAPPDMTADSGNGILDWSKLADEMYH